MRALVVDDEPLARSELVYALGRAEALPDGQAIAVDEAAEAGEALRMLAAGAYDVVFLDVNLPGMGGVEAAEIVARLERPPRIVFVTAHDDRAVDAFVVGAVDYVVKPVSPARLARTIARLRARDAAAAQPTGAGPSRLALEDGERTRLVKIAEVRYVQANGHVVTARVFDGDLRWRGSLGEAAARLEPAGFLRVHRAYLVNPERVVEVEPFFGGAYLLRVDDKARSEVPVSRNYMSAVKKALGL